MCITRHEDAAERSTTPDRKDARPGAYNILLDTELPAPQATSNDHASVWQDYYLPSVQGGLPLATPQGYGLSRVAQGELAPQSPVFYWQSPLSADLVQDHRHSLTTLVGQATGDPNLAPDGLESLGLTEETVTQAGWSPFWDALEITNGTFDATDVNAPTAVVPGWIADRNAGVVLNEPFFSQT